MASALEVLHRLITSANAGDNMIDLGGERGRAPNATATKDLNHTKRIAGNYHFVEGIAPAAVIEPWLAWRLARRWMAEMTRAIRTGAYLCTAGCAGDLFCLMRH